MLVRQLIDGLTLGSIYALRALASPRSGLLADAYNGSSSPALRPGATPQGVGRQPEPTRETDAASRDIAVFPLAMPLIAGSGAITAIVLLTENALHNIPQQAGTAITLCLVLAINYAVLKSAGPIHRLLGSTGTNVVARVTGLVLTALAVQVIIVGCQNVSPTSM